MATNASRAVGVDIGGTGIKAGIVDLDAGELVSDRIKVATPVGAEPADVLAAVKEVLETLEAPADLPLGVAFPVIRANSCCSFTLLVISAIPVGKSILRTTKATPASTASSEGYAGRSLVGTTAWIPLSTLEGDGRL